VEPIEREKARVEGKLGDAGDRGKKKKKSLLTPEGREKTVARRKGWVTFRTQNGEQSKTRVSEEEEGSEGGLGERTLTTEREKNGKKNGRLTV